METGPTQTQTLSIPSLVAFAVVSFFAIRWFFFSSPTATTSSTSSSRAPSRSRRHNFPPTRVDQISSMFPQLNRRDIEWDLVQNGGSVQATTEKVLMGGRLPGAPPNFTPLYDAPPAQMASTVQQQRGKQNYQDLITRYDLSSKVMPLGQDTGGPRSEVDGSDVPVQKNKGGWSSSKTERQALLKKRREEMILDARRKMEEREQKGKAPA